MKRWLLVVVAVLAFCLASGVSSAEETKHAKGTKRAKTVFTGEGVNRPFTVYGRFRAYNGGGTGFRIWVVGSTRMFWMEGSPAHDRITKVFGGTDNTWFTKEMYGEFRVQPLAKDIKGHMRPVRILGVKNAVLKEIDGKVILRRKEI